MLSGFFSNHPCALFCAVLNSRFHYEPSHVNAVCCMGPENLLPNRFMINPSYIHTLLSIAVGQTLRKI